MDSNVVRLPSYFQSTDGCATEEQKGSTGAISKVRNVGDCQTTCVLQQIKEMGDGCRAVVLKVGPQWTTMPPTTWVVTDFECCTAQG